jgi:O-antigen/teichoic acid export membrane protein
MHYLYQRSILEGPDKGFERADDSRWCRKKLRPGGKFIVRLASLMILARLLGPKDFGLVSMVTAFTGVLDLFLDFGLSVATVQRTTVTDEQISTLFWINLTFGVVIALVMVAMAPSIAAFLP